MKKAGSYIQTSRVKTSSNEVVGLQRIVNLDELPSNKRATVSFSKSMDTDNFLSSPAPIPKQSDTLPNIKLNMEDKKEEIEKKTVISNSIENFLDEGTDSAEERVWDDLDAVLDEFGE